MSELGLELRMLSPAGKSNAEWEKVSKAVKETLHEANETLYATEETLGKAQWFDLERSTVTLLGAAPAYVRVFVARGAEIERAEESPGAAPSGLTASARSRGGSQPKYNRGLQKAINRFRKLISSNKKMLTLSAFKNWVRQNASYKDRHSFDPPIPDCDDLYIDGHKLVWTDRDGRERDMSLKSIPRYISRANAPDTA